MAPGQYGGPANAPPRFIDVQKGRKERVIGDRRVIEEPGNRTIIRQGDKVVIRHDETERRVLFDLDVSVQRLAAELGQAHASVVALTGTYHNLLRMWADP